MSIALLEEIVLELPPSLHADILGYAKAVQSAIPEIFREAGLSRRGDLSDQLVLIAGVKKLYSICASNYSILDNSLRAMGDQARGVRVGSTIISRNSAYYRNLQQLQRELLRILREQDLLEFMELSTYSDILRRLAYG